MGFWFISLIFKLCLINKVGSQNESIEHIFSQNGNEMLFLSLLDEITLILRSNSISVAPNFSSILLILDV